MMMTLRLSLALEIDNLLCTARVSWLTRFCWQIISSIKEFVVFKQSELTANDSSTILWGALGCSVLHMGGSGICLFSVCSLFFCSMLSAVIPPTTPLEPVQSY